jgi:hypothetical protein
MKPMPAEPHRSLFRGIAEAKIKMRVARCCMYNRNAVTPHYLRGGDSVVGSFSADQSFLRSSPRGLGYEASRACD